MECIREGCHNMIPSTRRSDAKYCSHGCYKVAKKGRDALEYTRRTDLYDKVKFNDSILHIMFEVKDEIPVHYFDNLGFYFDIYISKDSIDFEELYVMYDYAYSIRKYGQEVYIKIWMIGKDQKGFEPHILTHIN